MAVTYQDLRDAEVDEQEIERKVGEGWTLQAIWDQAVEDGFIEAGCSETCDCIECENQDRIAQADDRYWKSARM